MPSSTYLFNEGSLSFDQDQFVDRTVNVLTLGEPEKADMNMTIARDSLRDSEGFADYVSRQIGMMEKQIKGYRLIQRRPCSFGSGERKFDGETIESVSKTANNLKLYQWQSGLAGFDPQHPARVLVFTVTQNKPFADEFADRWQALLSTYQPAA
jgi:hypothetical protein